MEYKQTKITLIDKGILFGMQTPSLKYKQNYYYYNLYNKHYKEIKQRDRLTLVLQIKRDKKII